MGHVRRLQFVLALAALAAAMPAAAADALFRATPQIVERGSTLTLSGSGWPSGVGVQLLVGPPRSEADPIKTVRAAGGSFRTTLPITAAAKPGPYVFLACVNDCRVKRSATVEIVLSRAQALALGRKAAEQRAVACGFRVTGGSASLYRKPVAGWKVELRLLFEDGHASRARWNVVGARAAPADPLARKIAAGCP